MYVEAKSLILDNIEVDEAWVVVSDNDIRIKRIMERDNVDFDMAVKKINSQYDYQTLTSDFDEVITNNSSLEKLVAEVDDLIDRKKL